MTSTSSRRRSAFSNLHSPIPNLQSKIPNRGTRVSGSSKVPSSRRRPLFERLEDRSLMAGVDISISDATATEGSSALKFIDNYVIEGSCGLARPRSSLFGPDGNSDGAADLYVASADTDEILRFDGVSGAFLDAFVSLEAAA